MIDAVRKVRWLREAALVERCHALPHHGSYSLGLHHHNCLMLLLALKPNASKELMIRLSTHDTPERWFGDMPAPAKWGLGPLELARAVEREDAVLEALGVLPDLEPAEVVWAEAIDRLEAWLWCHDQLNLGNGNVMPMKLALERWFSTNVLPERVQEFIANYHWERSSDKLPEELK